MTNIEEVARSVLALATPATPGPWTVDREDAECGEINYHVHSGTGLAFASYDPETAQEEQQMRADAEFIAACRHAAPALAEEVLRLRPLVATVERERDIVLAEVASQQKELLLTQKSLEQHFLAAETARRERDEARADADQLRSELIAHAVPFSEVMR